MKDYQDRDPRSYAIIGAAMEVHRQFGCGFLEAVYQEAFAMELADRDIPFVREQALPIFYKEHRISCDYRADFICFESLIVELKAVGTLSPVNEAQVINYLKAANIEVGLLINFGEKSLRYKRLIFSEQKQTVP